MTLNPVPSGALTVQQGPGLWHPGCRSDEHLVLHAIECCVRCGVILTRDVPFRQVAATLNTRANLQGLFLFGGGFLHCTNP